MSVAGVRAVEFGPKHYWQEQGGYKVGEKNPWVFYAFPTAINLVFDRLLQQKVNVIMTFIKGHSTSTPAK